MPKQNFGEAKSPFSLKSGNNIGGRNGSGMKFKEMGSSPVQQSTLGPDSQVYTRSLQKRAFGEGVSAREGAKILRTSTWKYNKMKKDYDKKTASKTTKQYTTSGKGTGSVDTTKQSVAVGPQTAETTKVSEQEFPTKGPVSTTSESTGESTSTYSKPFQRSKTGDPYSYRVSDKSTQFQSLRGRSGRTKGSWYDVVDPTAIAKIREFSPLTN